MYRLYDFECTKCDYKFEDLVNRDEDDLYFFQKCPKCGFVAIRIPSTYNFMIRSGPKRDSGCNRWISIAFLILFPLFL